MMSSPDKLSSSMHLRSGKTSRKKRVPRTRVDGPLRLSLSYTEMCLNSEGAVLQKEQVEELRIRQGFCPTCLGEPVRLFDIQRSRFNPLLCSKEPRNVEGECYNGYCLHCHPHMGPHKSRSNKSLMKNIFNRKLDTDGTITRPMANLMTSLSRRGDFDNVDNDGGLSRSPSRSTNGSGRRVVDGDEKPAANNGPSRGALMRSVTVRMTKTMTTLAEYTKSGSAGDNDQDSVSEDDENAIHGSSSEINDSVRSLKSFDRQAGRRHVSAAINNEEDLSRKETKTESPHAKRINSKRLSGRSSGSTLEDMYHQCRRDSRTRSTRRSTLLELDLSNIDFGDISDDDDEPRPPVSVGQKTASRQEAGISTRTRHDADTDNGIRSNRSVSFSEQDSSIQEENEDNRDPEEVIQATVDELGTLVKDLAATGNPDFAVDVLTHAMKSHPHAEAIQVFCLGTIWNFCKTNNSIKESVISSSAPEDTLLAMKEHLSSALVQERGCGIIRALSVSSKNRIVLMQAGAIARILRALEEHPNDEHVVATSVGALRTLSSESQARDAFLALDVKSIVVNAMELHRLVESIQRDGIVLLSNTAIEVDGSQVAAVPLEELEAIVQAMRAHQTNMSVKSVVSVACFALKNFSYDDRNVRTLLQCDGARALLEMAAERSVDPACRNDANIALEKLLMMDVVESSKRDALQQQLSSDVSEASIDELLRTIEYNDQAVDVMELALESVRQFAQTSESSRAQISESGTLEKIVAVMRKHEKSPKIQIEGCQVFGCFVGEELDVIEAGGCVAILHAMEVHPSNESVLIEAFKALKVLSVHFECWFELEQAGLMRKFRDAFYQNQDSAIMQQEGTQILMNFSAYSG